jgi:ComF family protein
LNSPTLLRQLKSSFLDLLFPLRCLGCGRDGSLLCPDCCQSLPRIKQPYCQRCGTPLTEGNLCPACISYPPSIEGIRSVFLFGGTVRQAIHQFKYRNIKAMAAPLGRLLADYLHTYPLPGDILVPVPLHSRRLRERGYNQSALLAKETGRLMGLPVDEGTLLRKRDTITQAKTANAAERHLNVTDAFSCRKELGGERVLLIDDVCTTGATLEACSVALKTAGAGSVWGLTVAREFAFVSK